MRHVLSACILIAYAGFSQAAFGANETTASTEAKAGAYKLDKAHASLIFRVNHLGFSQYTARFRRFDAELQFDPAKPAAMSVSATVDPASIETDYPDPAQFDFNAELRGDKFLDTVKFPAITFRSTAVELTGANTARVKGELALHGVTRPMALDVTFNGGYAGHPLDPQSRIGFSARGILKRSEFGMGYGIPAPGTTMGVSDAVEVQIEAEFNGPPLPPVKSQ
jgi:polyisoprenoid-binding protein YceI